MSAAALESAPTLESVTTPELLGRYAAILAELRRRGVVRTGNAPVGDYAEYVAHQVYGGSLAPNSAKSYDISAADGREIQVKARVIGPMARSGAVFSVFRTFGFHAATLIVLDAATYELRWAREVSPEEVQDAARWSAHVNGWLLRVAVAETLGIDVSDRFREVMTG